MALAQQRQGICGPILSPVTRLRIQRTVILYNKVFIMAFAWFDFALLGGCMAHSEGI